MNEDAAPPSPQLLRHWVQDRIRADILEGRFRPGEWLRQERLSKDYNVSQMPVREALKQLAAEGLVEHIPHRGARVVAFSIRDVEQLYACRAYIEGMAARDAAANINEEETEELRAILGQMKVRLGPRYIAEYRQLNRRFHERVFTASRQSFLVRTLAQLWAAFPTMLWSNFRKTADAPVPGRSAHDVPEHEAILAALERRDAEAAERAVRFHIEQAGRTLIAALRAQEDSASVSNEG